MLCLPVLVASAAAQFGPLASVQGLEAGDLFGTTLALAGDVDGDGTLDYVVGAPEAAAGGVRRGRVHVFSGFDHSPLLERHGLLDYRELGAAVDGAGDVDGDGHADIIVAAPWPGTATTLTWVHVLSGRTGERLLVLAGELVNDGFGAAVSGVGDVDGDGRDDVAVGAPDHHACPGPDVCAGLGRVQVFSGADGTVLLDLEGWQTDMRLGSDLDGPGDLTGDGVPDVLVLAPGWSDDEGAAIGAVFVVSGADGSIALMLGEPSGMSASSLGSDVGTLGDVDADGVPDFHASGTSNGQGFVRLWSGATGAWLQDVDTAVGAVAAGIGDLDGDGHAEVLFGSPFAPGLATQAGLVRVLSGADFGTRWIDQGSIVTEHFGAALAVLGDADGDGLPEYLAGQPYGGGPSTAGSVSLYEARLTTRVVEVVGDGPGGTGFGSVVRSAGDFDNDGVADILVGEPLDSTQGSLAGRARVFSGRDGAVQLDVLGEASPDQLGWSVAGAGDLDRDGYSDVLVGIPFRAPPAPGAVRAYSGRTGEVLLELEGHSAFDRYGYALAPVGDMDGDLVPDVLVGAPYDDTGGLDAGAAFLVSGATGATLLSLTPPIPLLGAGKAVAGGGDVDGDGVDDLLVGAPTPDGGGGQQDGAVSVYSGATGALLYSILGDGPGSAQFGAALAIGGDVDGDGLDDVFVGAPGYQVNDGRVSCFSGATGELLWHGQYWSDEQGGASLAVLDDLDGDAVRELLVGVPADEVLGGSTHVEGSARVLSGATGQELVSFAWFLDEALGGAQVDRCEDLDLDGRADLLVARAAGDGQPDGAVALWTFGDGTSPWSSLGGGLPGVSGKPGLLPSGDAQPGKSVVLSLSKAAARAPVTLVVGLSILAAPFKAGTLVPSPDLLVSDLVTDTAGALSLEAKWPDDVPTGTLLVLQAWVQDATGRAGWAASDALTVAAR